MRVVPRGLHHRAFHSLPTHGQIILAPVIMQRLVAFPKPVLHRAATVAIVIVQLGKAQAPQRAVAAQQAVHPVAVQRRLPVAKAVVTNITDIKRTGLAN